ncbi:MAG: YHS domain-containing protein [Desulfobaccales bacterium]
MKKFKALFLALTLTAFAAGGLWAADPKPQTVCPVLGGTIDKNVYADYQGKRIYFCCKGCDAEFNKNPEKYLKKMQEEGVTPEPSPAGAPKK